MHRAYAHNLPLNTDTILIDNHEEIHHIRDVLRLKTGDRLAVFNGIGEEAQGEILTIQKNQIAIRCLSYQKTDDSRNRPHFILACAIPKHSKFEWMIEKATELGADEIIPLKTARTEFHMTQDRAERKYARYLAVAVSASKQSKRLTVPKIHPITEFSNVLDLMTPETTALIPCLFGERKRLHDIFSTEFSAKTVLIFIGPEGDFTENEAAAARAKGAIPITLGETVLRVETAAISVLAFLKLAMTPTAKNSD